MSKDKPPIWKESEMNQMFVGIVGAESKKWPDEKIPKVTNVIHDILFRIKCKSLFSQILPAEYKTLDDYDSWRFRPLMITIVSGRCPVAVCESCNNLKFAPVDAPLEGYFVCPMCKSKKAIRKGGIDVITEAEAVKLKMRTRIFAPEENGWDDKKVGGKVLMGFKSRNIEMAKISDPLIVISPKCENPIHADLEYTISPTIKDEAQESLKKFDEGQQAAIKRMAKVLKERLACPDCKGTGKVWNGGLWTGIQAKKLGHKVVDIVI